MAVRDGPARGAGALVATLVALAPAARAQDAPAPEPSREHPLFGVGWKIGNGLGPRGADFIVAPWRRLAFELQVSYLETELEGASWVDPSATGWGIAPLVRAYLLAHGTTPYASAGAFVTRWTFRSLTWTVPGLFASAGAEWRPSSPFRLLLGAGVRYSPPVTASNGSESIRSEGGVKLNVELGLRYAF